MEKADIIKIFNEQIQNYATLNQYGVSKIPNHVHNGVDSPLVFSTLYKGQVQLTSGVCVVSNPNVTLSSLIYLSNALASITFGMLYISYQTVGSFTITSKKPDMSGTQTADVSLVNYLIYN